MASSLMCIGRIRIPVPMAQSAMALYDGYPEMRHVSHFDSVKAAMQVLPRYGRFANQDKRESIATGEAISVKPTSETSSAAQPTQRVRLRDGTSKRRRCWSSAEAAPDPVGGDTAPPAEGIESGQRPPPRRREWFARRNDCSRWPEVHDWRPAAGDAQRLPQGCRALTDAGFERISATVRAAVEAAGGDPGDLQVVEAKSS